MRLGHRFGNTPIVGLAGPILRPQIFSFGLGRQRDK